MRIVLVIYFLTIQSSYTRNVESDAVGDAFDTIQFLATDSGAWRIKTYAADQDVHVWSIRATAGNIVSLARQNTVKHYGDALVQSYVIETVGGIEGLRHELRERGLSDTLEISESGFLFWAPAGTHYRTRSRPQHEP